MSRSLNLFAACALALVFCAPGRAQDSPSLGDVARQAQKKKEKANKPAAKVITNDDMSSKSGGIAALPGISPQPAAGGNSAAAGNSADPVSPEDGLQKMQAALDHLDSLDRAGLAMEVLDGNAVNFPGRAQWEQQLFAAKQTFVAQTRAVVQKTRQITAAAAGMQDVKDPNDPRAKDISAKLQQLVAETQQNAATFQAVADLGRQMATPSVGQ